MPTFELTKHRALWNWLADNPGETKDDWPGWVVYHGRRYIENWCYACVYDTDKGDEEGGSDCCEYCPLVWPGDLDCCEAYSLYQEWRIAKEGADILAREIANLPVKEGVETR